MKPGTATLAFSDQTTTAAMAGMNAAGKPVAGPSQLSQHKMSAAVKGSLQVNSATRRKQRLVSAIPQTQEGRQARHARGATVTQSLVYDGQDRLGVPTGRLPLKTQDGVSVHAPATSADLSHMAGLPFKVKPNQLNIQTNMKQVSDYGPANGQNAFSPFTGMTIQPKSVLHQQKVGQASIFSETLSQPFSPTFQNMTFQQAQQTVDNSNQGNRMALNSQSGVSLAQPTVGRATSGGPDFYPRGKSRTNGMMLQGSAAATSGVPVSQSRRNIQVKVKRKKHGVDRALLASHDFHNGGLGTQKLLGLTTPGLQTLAQPQKQASGVLGSGVASGRAAGTLGSGVNLPASVTSPSASNANGASALVGAATGSKLGPQGVARRNRRTERAGGKYLMMSQDFSGLSKMQDLGQRSA